MKVEWKANKKLKPQIILDRLKACSSIDAEGKVSFNGFEIHELDSVLFTMIDFHKTFSYHTAKRFYNRALNSWVKSGSKLADDFLKALKIEVLSYNKQVPKEYVLVTSISIATGFPLRRIVLGDTTLECYPGGLPKKYKNREAYNARWNFESPSLPDSYCPVVVRFKSKNPMDGVEHALHELDFIRGVFCLDINPAFEIAISMRAIRRAPINKLTLGGMHTLHNKDGSLSDSNIFWYDSNYTERRSLNLTAGKKTQSINFFRFVTDKLKHHKDAHIIKDAIVRFVRAFDETDKNSSVQRGWAALESVMAPGENNTDLVVARCSYLYGEREYHRQILEHVKDYRNRNVHMGQSIDDPSPHCFQIQKFFRQAVIFHLAEVGNFSGLQDANKFLDSSASIEELIRQRDLIDKAILFISPE